MVALVWLLAFLLFAMKTTALPFRHFALFLLTLRIIRGPLRAHLAQPCANRSLLSDALSHHVELWSCAIVILRPQHEFQ